jgi:hypothetical protein
LNLEKADIEDKKMGGEIDKEKKKVVVRKETRPMRENL